MVLRRPKIKRRNLKGGDQGGERHVYAVESILVTDSLLKDDWVYGMEARVSLSYPYLKRRTSSIM